MKDIGTKLKNKIIATFMKKNSTFAVLKPMLTIQTALTFNWSKIHEIDFLFSLKTKELQAILKINSYNTNFREKLAIIV